MEERDETIKLAESVAGFANEKNAEDVVIMDMSRVSGMCDFFVVSSATSNVRAKTIADNIEMRMKQLGHRLLHREGFTEGKWILLDFGSIIAHVFLEEIRKYYNLEHLWGDAPRRAYTSAPSAR